MLTASLAKACHGAFNTVACSRDTPDACPNLRCASPIHVPSPSVPRKSPVGIPSVLELRHERVLRGCVSGSMKVKVRKRLNNLQLHNCVIFYLIGRYPTDRATQSLKCHPTAWVCGPFRLPDRDTELKRPPTTFP